MVAAESTAATAVTETVVAGALIGITQDLICFSSLFEFFFSFFITWIFIGVKLYRYLPVSFFNFFRCSRFTDTKYFVVISLLV
jgi:hypothetical protein